MTGPVKRTGILIALTRPVMPPTREEALAVESTEAPPPMITTTERVVVSTGLTPANSVIVDQQVEVMAGEWTPSGASGDAVIGGEDASPPVTGAEAARGEKTVAGQGRPEQFYTGHRKTGVREGAPTSSRHMGSPEFLAYLEGTEYPAGKHDLIDRAKANNAPKDSIDLLARFETKKYLSVEDVRKELSRAR